MFESESIFFTFFNPKMQILKLFAENIKILLIILKESCPKALMIFY